MQENPTVTLWLHLLTDTTCLVNCIAVADLIRYMNSGKIISHDSLKHLNVFYSTANRTNLAHLCIYLSEEDKRVGDK